MWKKFEELKKIKYLPFSEIHHTSSEFTTLITFTSWISLPLLVILDLARFVWHFSYYFALLHKLHDFPVAIITSCAIVTFRSFTNLIASLSWFSLYKSHSALYMIHWKCRFLNQKIVIFSLIRFVLFFAQIAPKLESLSAELGWFPEINWDKRSSVIHKDM